MPVSREVNTTKNYSIWNGGFSGGLFNSINGSLIPDNCLADISNLHIDHFGNLHSVSKPTQSTDCYKSNGSGSIRALIPTSLQMYINRNGTMYNEANQGTTWTVDTNTTQVAESPVAGRQWVTDTDGLWSAGNNITAADQDFADYAADCNSWTITEFEGRIVFNLGNLLRWSDLFNPELEEAWRGPKDPVNLTTMTLANCLFFNKMGHLIRKLQKCRGSLYTICDDGIYASSTLDIPNGTANCRLVYSGAYLPKFGTGAPFSLYSDGLAIYYVCNNKLIAFDGSNANLISDRLSLPSALAWYAGEYDNRLWFLLCTEAQPDGAVANAMYAIDKTTGAWEKYSVTRTSLNDSATETPTAMSAGNDPVVGVRGDRLWIGTNLGRVYYFTPTDSGTPLPWSFTTKTYTPSFDAYSRFVHFKIRYTGQASASPVTITQHVCRDGVDSTTDTLVERKTATTLDMVGSGGGMFQKDIECKAAKGEGVYFTVSGTGTCTINDVGIEFTTYGSGDVSA